MHLAVPRRHSARTLGLLLLFYGGVGALGMLVVILIAAGFALSGVVVTPERFAFVFLATAPFGAAIMVLVWNRYVGPRVKFDRQVAFEDFEALKRRYGIE
jgi:hypothetical protein